MAILSPAMLSHLAEANKMPEPVPVAYDGLSSDARRQMREAYAKHQGGRCWFCRAPLDDDPTPGVMAAVIDWRAFPPGFLTHPVHLHHDHKSGLTIGAVHARCNAYLWQYHGQ